MFKKIMVCLDGSHHAEQILPYAVEEAKINNGAVTLFRAVKEPAVEISNYPGSTGGIPLPQTNIVLEEQINLAEHYLTVKQEALKNEAGLDVEYLVQPGLSGELIVDFARDHEMDLIMIATHSHGRLERVLFGSTADHVVRNSGLPNLIICPEHLDEEKPIDLTSPPEIKRVLVCLDGSKLAEQILPLAVEQARYFGSTLVLLTVLANPDSTSMDDERESKAYLDDVAGSHRDELPDIEVQVLTEKEAGPGIVDFAQNNAIDMVMLCTHGRSGLSRSLYGSVADHVVRNVGKPVLVIKPKE